MGVNLVSLARRAPVSVYPCIGPEMLPAVEALWQARGIRLSATPRDAEILLVAGEIPDDARPALDRVHDQVPPPRAVHHWAGDGDPHDALVALRDRLARGEGLSPDRQPDEPPNEWRGKGDNGQGGKGMMGGVPYGRPMAMTDDDLRDGLALDAYSAQFGPFAPMLPPGLVLDLTLQGDVIVKAAVAAPPFPQPPEASRPVACAARLLRLLGLDGPAARVAAGRSPNAFFAVRAVPAGLGAAAPGADIRSRLRGWLADEPGTYQAPDPAQMLPGLEWHEAVLTLASYTPDALRLACLAAAEGRAA